MIPAADPIPITAITHGITFLMVDAPSPWAFPHAMIAKQIIRATHMIIAMILPEKSSIILPAFSSYIRGGMFPPLWTELLLSQDFVGKVQQVVPQLL